MQPNDERPATSPDHPCLRKNIGVGDLTALLEDRPGLVTAVSRRRSSPKPMAVLGSPPINVGIENCNESVEISCHCSVERTLKILSSERGHKCTVHRARSPVGSVLHTPDRRKPNDVLVMGPGTGRGGRPIPRTEQSVRV
jgi:hypothetical protein